MAQITDLQAQIDRLEGRLRQERSDHEITLEEIEALRRQILALQADLRLQNSEARARLEGTSTKLNAEITNLKNVCRIIDTSLMNIVVGLVLLYLYPTIPYT